MIIEEGRHYQFYGTIKDDLTIADFERHHKYQPKGEHPSKKYLTQRGI